MIILTTILRLLWPYLQRYIIQYVIDYLEQRRQRKLQREAEAAGLAELAQDLPPDLSPVPSEELPPSNLLTANVGSYPRQAAGNSYPVQVRSKLLTANAVWYTLSGILIGSILSLLLIFLLRKEK